VWSIFAPLWRTLSDKRSAPAPEVDDRAVSFEAVWTRQLARLGLLPGVLRDVIASGALYPHFRYRRFNKTKRDGGRREIAEPDPRLKRLQHEIVARYFGSERPHPAAVAYQKGKSTAHHIWAHAGAEILITADIRDFFPNTRADRVEAWWRERASTDAARFLTVLTTDRGGLPQGAPTSPGLSNFVNFELDARLARRAAAAGARYTRYCDDLAFSWPVGSCPLADFERGVRSALHEFGYALHPEKGWRVYGRGDEPEVTGAILTRTGRVRLPDRLRRLMRTLARSADPRDAQRLEGYKGYAAMVTRRPPT
jgi:RNA-directed DNA polymerase